MLQTGIKTLMWLEFQLTIYYDKYIVFEIYSWVVMKYFKKKSSFIT